MVTALPRSKGLGHWCCIMCYIQHKFLHTKVEAADFTPPMEACIPLSSHFKLFPDLPALLPAWANVWRFIQKVHTNFLMCPSESAWLWRWHNICTSTVWGSHSTSSIWDLYRIAPFALNAFSPLVRFSGLRGRGTKLCLSYSGMLCMQCFSEPGQFLGLLLIEAAICCQTFFVCGNDQCNWRCKWKVLCGPTHSRRCMRRTDFFGGETGQNLGSADGRFCSTCCGCRKRPWVVVATNWRIV